MALRVWCAAAGLAVASVAASGQIVVSRGDEKVEKKAEVESFVCQSIMRDGRVGYSGMIWLLDDSPTRQRAAAEFAAFIKQNHGGGNFEECHTWPSYNAPPRTEQGILATGWTGGYPTEYPGKARASVKSAAKASSPAPAKPAVSAPAAKGPTPNQLKYQRELQAYKARLAEIETIKADTAAKHAADRAAAEVELARHSQAKAAAEAAQRRYQEELAEHQRKVNDLETQQDRERKVDWREAVVVCTLDANDGQSRFGNWRCDGPLQMTYAKLGAGSPDRHALIDLSDACGGKPEAVRDLGLVNGSHLFGCGFGLHPKSTSGFPMDAAAKHGISFVPGRAIYRCPEWKSACRTQ